MDKKELSAKMEAGSLKNTKSKPDKGSEERRQKMYTVIWQETPYASQVSTDEPGPDAQRALAKIGSLSVPNETKKKLEAVVNTFENYCDTLDSYEYELFYDAVNDVVDTLNTEEKIRGTGTKEETKKESRPPKGKTR